MRRKRPDTTTRNTTHGLTSHPLFPTWMNMKARCKDSSDAHYGGKGITVCTEWVLDFMEFYEWALANGWKEGLTIERDRIDQGYSPDNCRWIPFPEQSRNRTNTMRFDINNRLVTICEFTNGSKLLYNRVRHRINKGFSLESAFGVEGINVF